jgi:hypothetical protein
MSDMAACMDVSASRNCLSHEVSGCRVIAVRQAAVPVYSHAMSRRIMYVQLKTGYNTDQFPFGVDIFLAGIATLR